MSSLALGIHIGHDSSCAVVRDGVLVSAIQTERVTRQKHHAVFSLSDTLPIRDALDAAGAGIGDVDVIVTSFQWVGPGGFGLHQPLVEPGFSLFDPWEPRHRVLSHHRAHAAAAYGSSPFTNAAVLVCDYAGSPTLDGRDYDETFAGWFANLTRPRVAHAPSVECMSLYRADTPGGFRLLERRYNQAHPGQASFVYSVAGLYENVSRYVTGRYAAHGALMALAAYGARFEGADFDPGLLVEEQGPEDVAYRNDWQHAMPVEPDFDLKCCLAWRCQQATEIALDAAARRAIRLSGSRNLAVGGGTFLNILANTRIATSGICSELHVPSAPHDAGISVGCAYHGATMLGAMPRPATTDRLGRRYQAEAPRAAVRDHGDFVDARPLDPRDVVEGLAAGKIVARWNGRAEFGPRALGGRSLLASPLYAASKDRLNRIKGRADWRPVAPVLPREDAATFLDGPAESRWMTMSQTIREEHRAKLPALGHPDHSTRAQTLIAEDDEELHSWLKAVGVLCGYPILVNTSFNRADEPIVETAEDAIRMFLDKLDIDLLVLGDLVVTRADPLERLDGADVRLVPRTFLTRHFAGDEDVHAATDGQRTWRISARMHDALVGLARSASPLRRVVASLASEAADVAQLRVFLNCGVLVRTRTDRR